ncbi:MAG TPA: UDP-N-acetylmuramoyl-L-alanine--D-glutamate ligase [Blastocatellia bacterium]|nr:UDP-N-acetylmuramoyl-L-alanine--D-glutamate ligase [Blastocatellia bacterium]
MKLAGKKVLVVGIARSGIAAARLLVSQGAVVIANDIKTESELAKISDSGLAVSNSGLAVGNSGLASAVEELQKLGVVLSLGGHSESLFRDADLIVLSPGVPADLPVLEVARLAGIEIISEPELAGRFLRGRMIGVTGSNGKTTVTTLIGELMRAAGADVIVGGNIGTPLTALVERSNDKTWTVAELSSFQLEMIDTLRVHVAVVTNITPDHLDRHGSIENYVCAKHRIFLNQTDDDWAILNGQDHGVNEMVTKFGVPSKKVYFSSTGRETLGDVRAGVYVRGGSVYTTMIADDESDVDVLRLDEVPLPGMHNIENVMTALAATICAMGTKRSELPALVDAIKLFKSVEHRIEYVAEIDGVKFFNDSKATNVDSTVKALQAFQRNIIVILGGKDKDSDYTLLGPLVRERVKRIVLIGAASDKIAAQLDGDAPMSKAVSMEEAVLKSMEVATAGDTVLLAPACASFDMFNNFEHRGKVFKEAVHKLAGRIHSGWTGRLAT